MKKSNFSSPLFWLKSVASISYILIGILLLMKPDALPFLDLVWARILGGILLAYGIFRFWRLINHI